MNRCKVVCHAQKLTLFVGHKQRFIHTHVTRSPPIGIAKLSEVFMNACVKENSPKPRSVSLAFDPSTLRSESVPSS